MLEFLLVLGVRAQQLAPFLDLSLERRIARVVLLRELLKLGLHVGEGQQAFDGDALLGQLGRDEVLALAQALVFFLLALVLLLLAFDDLLLALGLFLSSQEDTFSYDFPITDRSEATNQARKHDGTNDASHEEAHGDDGEP